VPFHLYGVFSFRLYGEAINEVLNQQGNVFSALRKGGIFIGNTLRR